jgi:Ca2+-binding EF-hand superfamily protein
MNRTHIFGAVIAVSLTSAALYAAPAAKRDADGNGVVTKAEMLAAADARFAKMDANNDGTLNEADKAAKIATRFAEMDADKNGSLSEAEFVAAHQARADKREDRREQRMGRNGPNSERGGKMGRHGGRHGGGMKMLEMADSNGDKSVSKAEFRAAAEARFAKADANGDGTISADERKAGRGKWRDRQANPADAG